MLHPHNSPTPRHAHLRAEGGDLGVGDALAPRVDGVPDGEGARGVGDADDVAGVGLLHCAARVGAREP